MTTENWLAISAGATFLLALAAFWAIWQTRTMHKKDRKERLLNEIIDWAEEISKASLIPDITLAPKNSTLMRKQREANVLLRYATSISRATSIETIAIVSFKNELLQDVRNVTDTVVKFTCIYHLKSLGVIPTEKAIPGKAREDIKKEIDKGGKSVDQLWQEYATKLANTTTNLLFKANVIKARLLK